VTHREADQIDELVVRGAVAERCLQIPLAAREETCAQLPVRGQADAVARRAERFRDGIDEPELAGAVGKAKATRRRRGLRGQLFERPVVLLDDRADLAAGENVVLAPRLVRVERHELDEPHDVRLPPCELGERRHLRLRESLHRNAVDLDRPQLWEALGLREPAQHRVERVAPGDLREAHVVERVERDVQALQPGLDERACEPVEQHAVRRQRQVAHVRDAGEHLDEDGQVAAHERLPAGQAYLLDPEPREHVHEPRDLLERQDLLAPEPLQALRRHAVGAAEVALVRDGHAHGLDLASPAVAQRFHACECTQGRRLRRPQRGRASCSRDRLRHIGPEADV
jgi:hypothetical protein